MSKLELWYPCKPFNVTQAWGIKNLSYSGMGFTRHNGVDFVRNFGEKTWPLYSPLKIRITDVGENQFNGRYVRFISVDKWDVLGTNCFVGGVIMHMESQVVSVGEVCEVGTYLGVADNTGNSTGPHTHLSLYRLQADILNENKISNRLDLDTETNNTFDPSPYWTKYYAEDYKKVMGIFGSIIKLLGLLLKK
jgi:murein DD-endopeptidase MepM/ murein hydrolase activator NlpD